MQNSDIKTVTQCQFHKVKNSATNDHQLCPGTLLWNFTPFSKAGSVWEEY